jgi:DNA-binding phage protein
MNDRSHDEAMAEQLHADPAYAAQLLIEVCRTGDRQELSVALRYIARSFGQGDELSLAEAERQLGLKKALIP